MSTCFATASLATTALSPCTPKDSVRGRGGSRHADGPRSFSGRFSFSASSRKRRPFVTIPPGTCQCSDSWQLPSMRLIRDAGKAPSPKSMLKRLWTNSVDVDDASVGDTSGGDATGSGSGTSKSRKSSGPSPIINHLPPDRVSSHPKLRTVSGHPVRTFGVGGNREVWQPNELPQEGTAEKRAFPKSDTPPRLPTQD
jgi:hypothetical protein